MYTYTRRWGLIPLGALLFILLVTACRRQQAGVVDSVLLTDDYGREVAVPLHPQRIVSTSPAVTEIIFALGGERLLVGRTEFCHYPAEVERIENIGGISNLNVEKIVSLQPDLVISGSMIPKKSIEQLDRLGVPAICVIEKKRFDGLYDNIGTIGRILGLEQVADSLVNVLKKEVSSLPYSHAALTDGSTMPTAYYVVGYGSSGNFTAGGDSFINDIIRLSGARNVADSLRGWSYSLEALMSQDPDYVIVRREDSAAFCQRHPYSRLAAVRKGNVIGIESGMIDLQVPRNIEAVKYLTARMHQ